MKNEYWVQFIKFTEQALFLFKKPAFKMFLFGVLLIGILLSVSNYKIPKQKHNKKISMSKNFSSKRNNFISNEGNDDKEQRRLLTLRKFFPDDLIYIKLITKNSKKTGNLNNYIDKTIKSRLNNTLSNNKNSRSRSKNARKKLLTNYTNETGAAAPINKCPCYYSCPTGYAVPAVYIRPPIFLFPPPIVVVANTTTTPPPPPTVPIPELSSVILSLTGLSGMLGFRKKIF